MDILSMITQINRGLGSSHYKKIIYNLLFSTSKTKTPPVEQMPANLEEFYKHFTHFHYDWETREPIANGEKIQGRINILKAESVVKDWEGVVYFKDIDHYDWIEDFKIVDFFVDEACVGYLQSDKNNDLMMFFEFGEKEPEFLGLDFNGYLELMFMARGFLYWQRVIQHLRKGKGYEDIVEEFKTYMPQIFPDFKWEEFVALYERVKIK